MLKKTIKSILEQERNISSSIKLYHRLANKTELDLTSFIKNVVNNGLIRKDNGEIGNVIWFSNQYDDYAKNGKFVVSIDYDKINKEKYDIHYDGHNGYAYKDIPFTDLDIIKIPVLIYRNVTSSDELIRFINEGLISPEKLNKLNNVTIYEDLFNKYVQPYINIENFINVLDNSKIKIINII